MDGEDLAFAVQEVADRVQASLSQGAGLTLVTREPGAFNEETRQARTMLETELKRRQVPVGAASDETALALRIAVSQGVAGRLLIAELLGPGEPEVIIVPYAVSPSGQSAALRRVRIAKSFLWRQADPILDAAVEDGSLWILSTTSLAVYRTEGGWKEHARWTLDGASASRDPRGRLATLGDRPVALLPGLECSVYQDGDRRLACRPSNRGWPIVRNEPSALMFAKSGGNYFERLQSATGVAAKLPPFFAAAPIDLADGGAGWMLACLDGVTRLYDASFRQVAMTSGWGSDLVARRPGSDCASCLIAVLSPDSGHDAVQAFRLTGAAAAPVSDALDVDGVVSALWAASATATTMVVKEKDSYAAWLLDVSCAD